MATSYLDRDLEAELEEARRREARTTPILTGFVGLVALSTLAFDGPGALSGDLPATGRVAVGVLGLVAAALLHLQPPRGWIVAMAWALIQIPVLTFSPDGSFTAQALEIPLAITNSQKINGELVSYMSIGINLVGVIAAAWLRVWRDRFDALASSPLAA